MVSSHLNLFIAVRRCEQLTGDVACFFSDVVLQSFLPFTKTFDYSKSFEIVCRVCKKNLYHAYRKYEVLKTFRTIIC